MNLYNIWLRKQGIEYAILHCTSNYIDKVLTYAEGLARKREFILIRVDELRNDIVEKNLRGEWKENSYGYGFENKRRYV